MRILRERIYAGATVTLDAPRVLHVASRTEDTVDVWFGDAPPQSVATWTLCFVGTGHDFDDDTWDYVGTAVTPSGDFVWHVLIRPAGPL